jgi:hypothetical protein
MGSWIGFGGVPSDVGNMRPLQDAVEETSVS